MATGASLKPAYSSADGPSCVSPVHVHEPTYVGLGGSPLCSADEKKESRLPGQTMNKKGKLKYHASDGG